MIELSEYIDLLLKENELSHELIILYTFSIIDSIVRESFFWGIIIIQNNNIDRNSIYLYITFALLAASIPIDNLYKLYKSEFLNKLEKFHYEHCLKKLKKISKKDLLNLDVNEYFNNIEIIRNNMDAYFEKFELQILMSVNIISILLILNGKYIQYIIPIFILIITIFYFIIQHIDGYEDDILSKNKDILYYIKYYTINSKNSIINDNFNINYPLEKINEIHQNKTDLTNFTINNQRILQLTIVILSILIAFGDFSGSSTTLLFIYEFETITNKLLDFNKINRHINLAKNKINIIENINIDYTELNEPYYIYDININKLKNNEPKLEINSNIKIYDKDKIFISGVSGSGKTTFLNIIKGIITPDELEISVNNKITTFQKISSNIFYTIQSDKNIFSANLYDIISNFSKNVNVDLIKLSLEKVLLDDRIDYNNNIFLDVSTLSGGELMRLYIAKLFYEISNENKQMIIIDEIDVNLNEEMSIEIHKNLLDLFKNKIIIVIAHNKAIKKLFKKFIQVKKGIIYTDNFWN